MEDGRQLQVLVAGGAGFLGSHLCERLVDAGAHVVCLDNLQTGKRDNLGRLQPSDNLEFVKADIVDPLPARITGRRFDRIYNLACAASPPLPVDDPKRRRPDIGRAERVLGWRPAVTLEQGLRSTIAWFEADLGRAGRPADEEVRLSA